MPHLGFAYPAGGRVGTTFTIYVGGQNLNATAIAFTSASGVTATVKGYDRPLTQKELNDIREKLQALQEKRAAARGLPPPERPNVEAKKGAAGEKNAKREAEKMSGPSADAPRPIWTAEDERMAAELRAQLAKRPNRQGNPAIAETITLEVTIAADVPPGDCELRLKTPTGISNPIILQVGELPEFSEPVVTATMNPEPRAKREPNVRATRPQSADMEIRLPATVNGQVMPGEVDRYRFTAKKGAHLTVAVSARALIPYLADAVPGWFQATCGLYDSQGREVAYSDSFRFSPDPVMSYEIPADDEYAIEIKDSIYRGREDFVYRVAIGELPFVTSIFPLGARATEKTAFELSGWNLPSSTLTFDPKDKAPGTFLLSVRNRGQLSNAVRFALDTEPSLGEAEPNDSVGHAQALTLPVVIDGRIQKPGDEDVFRISGKAGDEIIADVYARRLGSPLDSVLTLTDAAGKQLAANDDHEDKGVGLMTHHADSRIALKLPADGTYYLTLGDTQHHGGPEYGYRLRVGAPRRDFELRVTPSGINARAGTHVPITVYALRRDGFDGEILLALDGAGPGFSLSGARIPPGQDKIQLTLATPPMARDELVPLSIVGAAKIDGKAVSHAAVPAEDMMQAFAYHHLVTARTFLVNIAGRGATCRVLTRGPLQLSSGAPTKVTLTAGAARGLENVAVELSDPPEGVAVKSTAVKGDVVELTVSCDPAKAKVGTQGNLILNAFGERTNPNAKGAQQRVQRVPLGTVPAIPFEIVAASTPAVAKAN